MDGSIVYLSYPSSSSSSRKRRPRAKIVQWRGVPGLNKVKILREDEALREEEQEQEVVDRRSLHRLVSISSLSDNPFPSTTYVRKVREEEEKEERKRRNKRSREEEEESDSDNDHRKKKSKKKSKDKKKRKERKRSRS